jgi:mRNA interferase MazF
MRVSRGDVVLIDFPYSDRSGSKVRPALVVQNDTLNHRIDDTILAAISRSTHRISDTQLLVDITTADGQLTGLRQASVIQCENLLTFDQQFIIASIGRLPPSLIKQVDDCLKAALQLG